MIKKEKNKTILKRDLLGITPLFYSTSPFKYSDQKKTLIKKGYTNIKELEPTKKLIYNTKTKKISFRKRIFYKLGKTHTKNIEEKTQKLLIKSVKNNIPKHGRIGVMFSGGVDSTILAIILKKLGIKFICYTAGTKNSPDMIWAKKSAQLHKLEHKTVLFDEKKVEKDLTKICKIIESNNPVKVGVAIPFYYSLQKAHKDEIKTMFSGLGSEEIFAGYQRHEQAKNVNKECLAGLSIMWKRDTYRDYTLSKSFGIKIKMPFLDDKLIRYALNIPAKHKINKEYKKIVLRKIAERLGMHKDIAWRKKKAAQYGSQSDKVLERLSKNKGLRKTGYLKTRYEPVLRLGVLYSGGKDSNLALYLMKKRGHDIQCLITMLNEKEDSYMFHKPTKNITKLQSEVLSIPIVFGKTKGIKEKELRDLEKLIKTAQQKYELDGIITGALFSNYQRERIENICKKLGLSTHSPLWHMSQEQEMHLLLKYKFSFIMTSVAALGLNKNWLGKKITLSEINKLKALEKIYGLNIAGEGGEYESLVLNMPLFKKKLIIQDYEIINENQNTAKIKIKKIKI